MEPHASRRIDIAVRIAFVIVLLAVVGFWPKTIHVSPSFDCTKATLPTEKLICGDSDLAKLDSDFAIYYADNLATVAIIGDRAKLEALIAGQRNFMEKRNRCDSNTFCVMQAYGDRERQLRELLGSPPPPADLLNGSRSF